jgi:Endonuclease/Exonuclease/phosphatase family
VPRCASKGAPGARVARLTNNLQTTPVRILTWNLNHRAAERTIPPWIAGTIGGFSPHLVILTEYVQGPDHGSFLGQLADQGLPHSLLSGQVHRQNQILMASRDPLAQGHLIAPDIHPSVRPNFLHGILGDVDVFGFRLPAFEGGEEVLKRRVWSWLVTSIEALAPAKAVLAGDFNTAVTDNERRGGDMMRGLISSGWGHALPTTGVSFGSKAPGRVIDHIFTRGASLGTAEFSWSFQEDYQKTRLGVVGLPDHAVLTAEVEFG